MRYTPGGWVYEFKSDYNDILRAGSLDFQCREGLYIHYHPDTDVAIIEIMDRSKDKFDLRLATETEADRIRAFYAAYMLVGELAEIELDV